MSNDWHLGANSPGKAGFWLYWGVAYEHNC